jgi:arylsulfatase A-like enzyme
MKDRINRRDFLKLAGLFPLSIAAPRLLKSFDGLNQQGQRKNVIIIVFDAWSAYNVSLYGYSRDTTPTINRLAKRALRYHNHFAGGNFTSPGTASILTGVLPWTHRAFQLNGEVVKHFETRNFFTAFQDHYSIAYTHNSWAYTLLRQCRKNIDELIIREKLMIPFFDTLITQLFTNDFDIASVSWARNMKISEEGYAYSMFLSHIYEQLAERKTRDISPLFPRGIPTSQIDIGFTLEQARNYIMDRLVSIPRPFAGYFHFLPPHSPYNPSIDFFNTFKDDGFAPANKPLDIFEMDEHKHPQLKRKLYDEFILYCDDEFGKLYNSLKQSGLLEDTWLVLTSDHGELFERGIIGHSTSALYQPVVRVPLLIFEPGRTEGMDIYDHTSAIDLLPTLTHVTGEPLPDWTEGLILPPFAPAPRMPDRNVYVVRATENGQYDPFSMASLALVRGDYKLHYYFGYKQTPDGLVKLYNIKSDPEEMTDLATVKRETTAELFNELKQKLKEVDEPYIKS